MRYPMCKYLSANSEKSKNREKQRKTEEEREKKAWRLYKKNRIVVETYFEAARAMEWIDANREGEKKKRKLYFN